MVREFAPQYYQCVCWLRMKPPISSAAVKNQESCLLCRMCSPPTHPRLYPNQPCLLLCDGGKELLQPCWLCGGGEHKAMTLYTYPRMETEQNERFQSSAKNPPKDTTHKGSPSPINHVYEFVGLGTGQSTQTHLRFSEPFPFSKPPSGNSDRFNGNHKYIDQPLIWGNPVTVLLVK